MATKNKPGEYDCYDAADPDEPIFTLRAHDKDAPVMVKMWAFLRMQQIDMGLKPESDRKQVSAAIHCATEMEIWRRAYQNKKELQEEIEFDKEGHPLIEENDK